MIGSSPLGSRPLGAGPAPKLSTALPPKQIVERRLVAEIIGTIAFVLPTIGLTIQRDIAEIIGSVSGTAGKRPMVSRSIAEVVGSARSLGTGFSLPSVSVTSPMIAFAFSSLGSGGPGVLTLDNGAAGGLFLSGNSSTTQFRYSDGANSVTGSWSTGTGKHVLAFNAGATPSAATLNVDGVAITLTPSGTTWNPVTLTNISQYRDPSAPHSTQLAELMVWPTVQSGARVLYIYNYLVCKWITAGCNPNTSLGTPPA